MGKLDRALLKEEFKGWMGYEIVIEIESFFHTIRHFDSNAPGGQGPELSKHNMRSFDVVIAWQDCFIRSLLLDGVPIRGFRFF